MTHEHGIQRRTFLGGVLGGAAAGALPAAHAEAAVPHGVRLQSRMRTDREWSEFLAGQDLIWKRPPRYWNFVICVERTIGPKLVSSSRMMTLATNDVVANMNIWTRLKLAQGAMPTLEQPRDR